MNCPKCQKTNHRKDGIINGKQRYYCASCNFHYTVCERNQKPITHKRVAVALHIIGLSNRKIKKILGASDVAIMNWINKYKEKPEFIKGKGLDVNILSKADLRKILKTHSNLLLISIDKDNNGIYKITT